MTNLSPGAQGRPSRQQVLLAAPALVGLLLALGVAAGLVWPAWRRLQQDQLELSQLHEQQLRLPLLRSQIAKALENEEQGQAKREQILGLIAGSGEISTFMTQLAVEAQRSGVQLDGYEPVVTQAEPEPKGGAAKSRGQQKEAPRPVDPLLAPGLVKTSVLLTARGTAPQVQDFLRRLEALSLLVVQSDLSLKAEAPEQGAKTSQPRRGQTSLKLNLGLYAKGGEQPPAPRGVTPP
jgi:type IV pilus assembly protein PilO